MSSLTESLRQVMAVDGVRAAALIDIATGMVVQSAGVEGRNFPAAAASMADEARMARAASGPDRPGGDLDEISLVSPTAGWPPSRRRARPVPRSRSCVRTG